MELLNILLKPLEQKTCSLCFKQSETFTDIHEVFEIRSNAFICLISISNMVKELLPAHEDVADFVCEYCSSVVLEFYTLILKNQLKHHLLDSMIENIDREINEKGTSELEKISSLFLHISTKTPGLPNSTRPEENIDEYDVSKYKCKKCEMSFHKKALLQNHKKITHSVQHKAGVCYVCGKTCNNPNTLKSHMNSHQIKPCPHCGKVLKTHTHFSRHIRNHKSGLKSVGRRTIYRCNECQYESLNKNSLEAHINKFHLHHRPYVCEVCFKSFYKKSNLVEHSFTHSKSKTETCEYCGESFVSKKILIEHLRLHTGERPYECEVCQSKFVSASRKTEHFKRKHLEKCESCNFCGKRFSVKKDLNRHVKKVHLANVGELVNIPCNQYE